MIIRVTDRNPAVSKRAKTPDKVLKQDKISSSKEDGNVGKAGNAGAEPKTGTAGNAGKAGGKTAEDAPKDKVILSKEGREEPDSKSGGLGSILGGLSDAFGDLSEEDRQRNRDVAALRGLDNDYSIYDNPGGGDQDGVVSYDDLQNVADGDFNRDAARQSLLDSGVAEDQVEKRLDQLQDNAEYLLGRTELLESLDTANDDGNNRDEKISRGDLQRGLNAIEQEVLESGGRLPTEVGTLGEGEFELPHGDHDHVTTGRGGENRTAEVAQAQEAAILDALNGDGTVEFTNTSGQTEELSISQVQDTGGDVVFELTGADGHKVRISSELGAQDSRIALARIADYWTQTPEAFRDGVKTIELHKDEKGEGSNAAADFNSGEERIRFFHGLDYVSEAVFDHEFGHSVGYQTDGNGEGVGSRVLDLFRNEGPHGAPEGWVGAIESDGSRLTEYAGTNHKEDFAESWTTFLEAVEHGDQALDEFQERFPARFEILEEIYMEATAA